jgi:hypothetical protein
MCVLRGVRQAVHTSQNLVVIKMHGTTIKKYILHLFDNYNKIVQNAWYNKKIYLALV